MTFEEYLERNAGEVNAFLDTFFDYEDTPDIRRYLYDPLSAYTSNAGKRHRPLICMLACLAVGGDPQAALQSGAAIEHFHTAALIHDDIADDSHVRRGKPCMHIVEGVGLAINAGDMSLSSVMSSVLRDQGLSPHVKLQVIGELVDMDMRTIEGQALDIGWARDGRFDIGIDDYLLMATRKTAYYSGGVPLAIGAIIGGGTSSQIEALREFGTLTGLAFQIQDDLLNLVGSEQGTRKDFRSDITEGKRTYMVVHALDALDTPESRGLRDELIGILDARTQDARSLERAVQIMQQTGSLDAASSYARTLTQQAKQVIEPVLPDSDAKQLLLSMADYFVSRQG